MNARQASSWIYKKKFISNMDTASSGPPERGVFIAEAKKKSSSKATQTYLKVERK
jgi:hypothetical protein